TWGLAAVLALYKDGRAVDGARQEGGYVAWHESVWRRRHDLACGGLQGQPRALRRPDDPSRPLRLSDLAPGGVALAAQSSATGGGLWSVQHRRAPLFRLAVGRAPRRVACPAGSAVFLGPAVSPLLVVGEATALFGAGEKRPQSDGD